MNLLHVNRQTRLHGDQERPGRHAVIVPYTCDDGMSLEEVHARIKRALAAKLPGLPFIVEPPVMMCSNGGSVVVTFPRAAGQSAKPALKSQRRKCPTCGRWSTS